MTKNDRKLPKITENDQQLIKVFLSVPKGTKTTKNVSEYVQVLC